MTDVREGLQIMTIISRIILIIILIFFAPDIMNTVSGLFSDSESESDLAFWAGHIDGWFNESHRDFESDYIQFWYDRGYSSGEYDRLSQEDNNGS
jgi:hypothetical protein